MVTTNTLGPINVFDASGSLIGNFNTIQAAVNYAASVAGSGKTIVVDGHSAPPFAGQVVVDGSSGVAGALDGLTLKGINGAVIQAPSSALVATATDPNGGRSLDGVLTIMNTTNVTVEGLTVDGATEGANFQAGQNDPTEVGIAVVNANGTVIGDKTPNGATSVTVENVRESDAGFGNQRNLGIYVSNSAGNSADTVTIGDTVVSNFQKTGIEVKGAAATVEYDTVTGTTTGSTAQNGIEIADSSGTVAHNTVQNVGYTRNDGAYNGSGIITFDNHDLSIDSNNISLTGKYTTGIFAYDVNSPQSNVSITNNTITGAGATGGISAANYSTGIYYEDGTGGSISGNSISSFDVAIEDDAGQSGTTAPTIGTNSFEGGIGSVFFMGDGAVGQSPQTAVTGSTFAAGGPGQVYVEDASGNIIVDTAFSSIQAAINAASAGDTIHVGKGVYNENLTIDTDNLTIVADQGAVLNGTFKTDNGIPDDTSVADFLKTRTQDAGGYTGAAGSGIDVNASGTTIQGLTIQNFLYGVNLEDGADQTALTDVDIDNSVIGIKKGTTASIDGLTLTGGSISDGVNGVEFDKSTDPANAAIDNADHVQISGTSFSNLDEKGIYAETLLNSSIDGVTMTNVGQFGTPPTFGSPAANNGDGIDLNLKNGVYSGDSISNFTLTNTGSSDTDSSTVVGGKNGGGIVVETRNDGSYASAPASYSGTLAITDGTISGTSTGIEVGEPGKSNSGPAVTITGVSVTGADTKSGQHGDIGNQSTATVTFNIVDGTQTVTADPNSTGPMVFNAGAGNQTITGGAGDDTFVHGAGNDTFNGGDGMDTAEGYSANAKLSFNGTNWVVTDGATTDTLSGIDKVLIGGKTYYLVNSASKGGYQTVQSAVDAASSGDAIAVAAGVNAGNVTVTDKALSFIGVNAGINGANASRSAESIIEGHVTVTGSQPVSFDGLEFELDGTTGADDLQNPAIRFSGNGAFTVENSLFYSAVSSGGNAGTTGVLLDTTVTGAVSIEDNAFAGNSTGLYSTASWGRGIWSDGASSDLTISGNTFNAVRSALNLDGYDDTTHHIADNTFASAGTAISVGIPKGTSFAGISGNDFQNVGDGLNFQNVTTPVNLDVAGSGNGSSTHNAIVIDGAIGGGTYEGSSGANVFIGLGGNDTFYGGNGADTVIASAGNDVYYGEGIAAAAPNALGTNGDADSVVYANAANAYTVTENADGSVSVGKGSAGTDQLHGIEKIVFSNGQTGGQTDDLTAPFQVLQSDGVTLVGTGATIGAAINLAGSDDTIVTTTAATLTAQQAQQLFNGEVSVSAPSLTLTDSGENIAALSAPQLASLSFLGITAIASTDAITVSLQRAQALEAAGLPISVPAGDSFTVADTVAHLQALSASQIAGLGALHVTTIEATSGSLSLNVAQASALGNAGISATPAAGQSVTITDTAADVQAGLAALTTFAGNYSSITISDAASGKNVGVSTAVFDADEAALDKIAQKFQIVDTGKNINADLSALNADAAHISKIVQTDIGVGGTTPPVTVTVSNFQSDETALNEVNGGFDISDTAASIQLGIAAINADASHIVSISTTDVPVAVGIAKFTADAAALNKVTNGFNISGQAAAISANLDAIQQDLGQIDGVTALNGTVTASVATLAADRQALDLIGSFAISDTAADIQAGLTTLNGDLGRITAIGSTDTTVTVGVGKFDAYQGVLNKTTGGFNITGQASAISGDLGALKNDASHIDGITALNGSLAVSVATFGADQAILDKVSGGVTISDSAANIGGNLSALGADVAHIGSVVASNGTVTVGFGKLSSGEAVLDKVAGGFNLTGQSSVISSNFDTVAADGNIGAIAFANGNAVLNLSAAQASTDAATLAKITSPYVLNVDNGDGTVTTTGHGNGLTIAAVATGNDTLTGNGTSENFVFQPAFGQDTITDFSTHMTGPGNDIVTLPSSEFTDFATMLQHAQSSGSDVVITAPNNPGDVLTLSNVTTGQLQSADFKFV